jgi:ComF family protein
MKLRAFGHSLVDFFFPPKCALCGQIPEDQRPDLACSTCQQEIPMISHPFCPRCGVPFEAPGEDHLCSGCLTEDRFFSRARAVGLYEGWAAEMISRFKYRGASHLAVPLGNLMADCQDPEFRWSAKDLLVPVPLHPRRLRQRGFNQSLLLARQISRRHSIPVDFLSLERIRMTIPQIELSGAERRKNLRGAFQVHREAKIHQKRILLVDDVFTTGTTVQECSKALLQAGAEQVDVITFVRAR